MVIKVKLHYNNTWLKESGYTEEEEAEIYQRNIQDILDNPRWYLDRVDYLNEYKVSWTNYNARLKKGRHSATLPYNLRKK
jgi:hypothetical protein